jgi:hypothetical protein
VLFEQDRYLSATTTAAFATCATRNWEPAANLRKNKGSAVRIRRFRRETVKGGLNMRKELEARAVRLQKPNGLV